MNSVVIANLRNIIFPSNKPFVLWSHKILQGLASDHAQGMGRRLQIHLGREFFGEATWDDFNWSFEVSNDCIALRD